MQWLDDIALGVGQGFCNLAGMLLPTQFRCRDPAALSKAGYTLIGATLLIGFWRVFARLQSGEAHGQGLMSEAR